MSQSNLSGGRPTDVVYQRASRVVWRRGADIVLVRRIGQEALELNGMAAFIWASLEHRATASELIAGIELELGTVTDESRETLSEALDSLLEYTVIETVGELAT